MGFELLPIFPNETNRRSCGRALDFPRICSTSDRLLTIGMPLRKIEDPFFPMRESYASSRVLPSCRQKVIQVVATSDQPINHTQLMCCLVGFNEFQ
jgi:hypothetical protein